MANQDVMYTICLWHYNRKRKSNFSAHLHTVATSMNIQLKNLTEFEIPVVLYYAFPFILNYSDIHLHHIGLAI